MPNLPDARTRAARRAFLRLVQAAAEERERASAQLAALQGELTEIRERRAYRMVLAFVDASGSFRDLLALPGRLLRLVMERKSRPETGAGADEARSASHAAGAATLRPTVPAYHRSQSRPRLRIVAIVDEFTERGLQADCDLVLPGPEGIAREIRENPPDLFLVESAWSGNGGRWRDSLEPDSVPLLAALDACSEAGVPTVFWNKEDPSHFEHFLAIAAHFDHVYTSDADCLGDYRRQLGGDRFGVLAFCCQPRLHNPIEASPRQPGFMFAGSFYRRYPERQRRFDELVEVLSPLGQVDIYDRNHDNDHPDFEFPAKYADLVRGGLDPDEVLAAYKRYRFAINLNTITDSPTMLSRRVFELLASNTVVVSNPARAMTEFFGDAVLAADTPEALGSLVQAMQSDETAYRRRRLAGMRAAIGRHAWSDRLDQLAREVLGRTASPDLPEVVVLAAAGDDAGIRRAIEAFRGQSHPRRRLVLVGGKSAPDLVPGESIEWLSDDEASAVAPARRWPGAAIAVWHPQDHYGRQYLADLVLVARYSDARVATKASYWQWTGDDVVLVDDGRQYRTCGQAELRCSLLLPGSGVPGSLSEWLHRAQAGPPLPGDALAIDEFNYCRDAAGSAMAAQKVAAD